MFRLTRIAIAIGKRSFLFLCTHAQRNHFGISLFQTKFGLLLPFSDRCSTNRNSVWRQINWKNVTKIIISFLFDAVQKWDSLYLITRDYKENKLEKNIYSLSERLAFSASGGEN